MADYRLELVVIVDLLLARTNPISQEESGYICLQFDYFGTYYPSPHGNSTAQSKLQSRGWGRVLVLRVHIFRYPAIYITPPYCKLHVLFMYNNLLIYHVRSCVRL
jgi:hypothetical protein